MKKGGTGYFAFIFETTEQQTEFPCVFVENANDEIPLFFYHQSISDLPDIITVTEIEREMSGPARGLKKEVSDGYC